MPKRKICIITGTRAEYGLLYWLMHEINADPELELQIVATGMHLSPEFGLTYQAIEEDGFYINEKVEMLLSSDTETGTAKSLGLGVIGFSDALHRLKPDIIVVLGDRFEIMAAVQTAMLERIPIAHIHGGETTEGVIDEPIRHSITKMAHIHFTAAEEYRNRVIQLGEHPDRVFNVGTPALENLQRLILLERKELENLLEFKFGTPTFLLTYHPITLRSSNSSSRVEQVLSALDEFPHAKIIITKSNADAGGRIINQLFDKYAETNVHRTKVFTSLGQIKYLSTLKYVDVVIGNSSSGVIEAPLFKKPTIDIGDRQKGRLKATSIIECGETKEAIVQAIKEGLSRGFQRKLTHVKSKYGEGNASFQMKEKLKKVDLNEIIMKRFYDLNINF